MTLDDGTQLTNQRKLSKLKETIINHYIHHNNRQYQQHFDFFNQENPFFNFLDKVQSDTLEGGLNYNECTETLRSMQMENHREWMDFTIEFYKFFGRYTHICYQLFKLWV